MQTNKEIVFCAEDHSYRLGDKILISVTQLLKKHGLSPDYSAVREDVLTAKAARGTLIHKEVEDYLKTGEQGFTSELYDFINIFEENSLNFAASEHIVHNDILAGTIDLIGYTAQGKCDKTMYIGDIKTSVAVNKEAVRWQLSLYEYLHGFLFDKMVVFHLGEKSKMIEVQRIPREQIEALLECERNGEIYQTQGLVVSPGTLAELCEVESLIKDIETQKKLADERAKTLREEIHKAMQEQGISSFETDDIKITLVEPYTRETIDSKKLKKDLPDIAKQYMQVSTVKGGVRITLRS